MLRTLLVLLLQAAHAAGALALAFYGIQTIWLTWKSLRLGAPPPLPAAPPGAAWPPVTVQLPVYNERHVVERLLDACTALDYPRDRLQIQVLDDSDDDTTQRAEQRAALWRARGMDVTVVRRGERTGYKAGALAHALPLATGEIIVLFDADFAPPPDFLRRTVGAFLAPGSERTGFVQVRWGHLNPTYSLLTRCQALALDGHFGVEQPARFRAGYPFGFNGSAGAWRRACIEDAAVGGWQSDTLCEDLDLAYRAQLAGWRGLYTFEMAVPAEIPPQVQAFKRQQFRWAKGTVQALRKLAGRVARSGWSRSRRLAAFGHLGSYLIHPALLLLLLAYLPLALLDARPLPMVGALGLASLGPPLLYATAAARLYPGRWLAHWLALPLLMLFGLGLSLNNAVAVWEGFRHNGGAFLRTPKFRIEQQHDSWRASAYRLPVEGRTLAEVSLALYAAAAATLAWRAGDGWAAAFMALYALSFGATVGVEGLQARRQAQQPALVAEPLDKPLTRG
jgi:cellulose synthase/poly-beta-1,6-N-acetylglucosamine synthase-like glycosyltransferase